MASITNKEKGLSYNKNREISSIHNVGNREGITSSENGMNRKKPQKIMKDNPTKSNITQNTFGVRRRFNRIETVKRVKSVASHILVSAPFFLNEANKRLNTTKKENLQVKNSAKIPLIKTENVNQDSNDTLCNENKKLAVSNLNDISSFSESDLNPVGEWKAKWKSLIDIRKIENSDIVFPQTRFSHSAFSVISSETLNLNNFHLPYNKDPFDLLKKFELIRYGNASNELKLSENEQIFSLVPTILPSEPVTLQRKRYKCGMLSVNNYKDASDDNRIKQKEGINETTMEIKFEKTDVCGFSSDSEVDHCLQSDDCFRKNNDYTLILKNPMRMKCFDENSGEVKDIIIFSDDFLKSILKETNNSASKKEIYENILKKSTVYKGKRLRIITDAKQIFSNLISASKSGGDIKMATSKISSKIPKKLSNGAFQTNKKGLTFPHSNKFLQRKQQKETKKTLTEQNVPLKNDTLKKTVDVQSVMMKREICLIQTDPTKNEKLKCMQGESKKFGCSSEQKSRTASKRINIESVVASGFSNYFHFYAKLGRPVKSGAAISKTNSINWLRKCGIVCNDATKSMAEKCFMSLASTKCVLNIGDYIKCLNKFARNTHKSLVDVLYQMMSIDIQPVKKPDTKKEANQRNEEIMRDSTPGKKTGTKIIKEPKYKKLENISF